MFLFFCFFCTLVSGSIFVLLFFFGDHFQQKLGVELDLGDRVRCAEGSLCASSMVLSPAMSWQEITSEQLLQKVIEKRLQELLGTLLSKCGFG